MPYIIKKITRARFFCFICFADFQCFMNSVLQCLSNTRPVLEFVLSDEYAKHINTSISSMNGALIKGKVYNNQINVMSSSIVFFSFSILQLTPSSCRNCGRRTKTMTIPIRVLSIPLRSRARYSSTLHYSTHTHESVTLFEEGSKWRINLFIWFTVDRFKSLLLVLWATISKMRKNFCATFSKDCTKT